MATITTGNTPKALQGATKGKSKGKSAKSGVKSAKSIKKEDNRAGKLAKLRF